MTFRIKFAKFGVIRFIGHLDVMRYFQKVIRRSELPVSYSQGFSPHQLMSFALPLGVGITSDGEYMEVDFDGEALYRLVMIRKQPDAGLSCGSEQDPEVIRDTVSDEELENTVFAELERNTTEGFEILKVKRLPDPKMNVHQDKAMSLVTAADYLISVKDGYDTGFASKEEFLGCFTSFLDTDTIEVTKKTKKSEKVINIRDYIYSFRDDGFNEGNDEGITGFTGTEHAPEYENGIRMAVRLAAGSVMNIKPELVLEAFMSYAGHSYDENAFALHRMDLLTGEKGSFKSLI